MNQPTFKTHHLIPMSSSLLGMDNHPMIHYCKPAKIMHSCVVDITGQLSPDELGDSKHRPLKLWTRSEELPTIPARELLANLLIRLDHATLTSCHLRIQHNVHPALSNVFIFKECHSLNEINETDFMPIRTDQCIMCWIPAVSTWTPEGYSVPAFRCGSYVKCPIYINVNHTMAIDRLLCNRVTIQALPASISTLCNRYVNYFESTMAIHSLTIGDKVAIQLSQLEKDTDDKKDTNDEKETVDESITHTNIKTEVQSDLSTVTTLTKTINITTHRAQSIARTPSFPSVPRLTSDSFSKSYLDVSNDFFRSILDSFLNRDLIGLVLQYGIDFTPCDMVETSFGYSYTLSNSFNPEVETNFYIHYDLFNDLDSWIEVTQIGNLVFRFDSLWLKTRIDEGNLMDKKTKLCILPLPPFFNWNSYATMEIFIHTTSKFKFHFFWKKNKRMKSVVSPDTHFNFGIMQVRHRTHNCCVRGMSDTIHLRDLIRWPTFQLWIVPTLDGNLIPFSKDIHVIEDMKLVLNNTHILQQGNGTFFSEVMPRMFNFPRQETHMIYQLIYSTPPQCFPYRVSSATNQPLTTFIGEWTSVFCDRFARELDLQLVWNPHVASRGNLKLHIFLEQLNVFVCYDKTSAIRYS